MSTDRIEEIEDLDALFESVRAQAELQAGTAVVAAPVQAPPPTASPPSTAQTGAICTQASRRSASTARWQILRPRSLTHAAACSM